MNRGKLDKEAAAKVERELPDVNTVRVASLHLQPDFISLGFPQGSTIPIATPCLQDVTSALQESRYALREALAHIVWHREKRDPPDERDAVFFGKFYADDAAQRMYATGEHLANAILNMLGIKQEVRDYQKLKLAKRKNISSKQAIVGSYLIDNEPDHEITKAIRKLKESEDWGKTRDYRDNWVHGQPPIVKGMGIAYERRNRLKVTATSIGISFGGGDAPRYSIDDILGFIKPALVLLTEVATEVVEYYVDYLNKNQKRIW
jgi:ribosomal protein S13